MNKLFPVLAVGSLLAAGTLGLFLHTTANAQEPTPEADLNAPSEPGHIRGKGFRNSILFGASDDELAAALGISAEELETAYDKANDAALDRAVAEGLITEAQANDLREGGDSFPFGGFWKGWLGEQGIDYQSLLAESLGISISDLDQAYAQAFYTRIDEEVSSGDLTVEEGDLIKGQYALYNSESFQTAMQSAYQAAIQQAVEDGVITQSQAEQILENSASGTFPGLGKGYGPHMEGHFSHNGRGGEYSPGRMAPAFPSLDTSDNL